MSRIPFSSFYIIYMNSSFAWFLIVCAILVFYPYELALMINPYQNWHSTAIRKIRRYKVSPKSRFAHTHQNRFLLCVSEFIGFRDLYRKHSPNSLYTSNHRIRLIICILSYPWFWVVQNNYPKSLFRFFASASPKHNYLIPDQSKSVIWANIVKTEDSVQIPPRMVNRP